MQKEEENLPPIGKTEEWVALDYKSICKGVQKAAHCTAERNEWRPSKHIITFCIAARTSLTVNSSTNPLYAADVQKQYLFHSLRASFRKGARSGAI